MNTLSLLLDTNIIIAVLNNYIQSAALSEQLCMSAISLMELYALAGMAEQEENRLENELDFIKVLPVNAATARQAGLLSRTRRRGVRSDLLIAATALEHRLPLLTNNTKDFKNISGLILKAA